MIYFISGHRDITQEEFDANYVPAIEDAIDNGQTTWEDCEFIVGDCKGCDQMAAEYIAKYIEENMDDWDCVPCTLTIHHMFSEPRFRVGTKADEDVRHIINILNRNDMWNDKLNAMIADSMKKHDTTRTNVYRAIKTAFTNYAAAKNAKPLDEAAEISIIKKMRDERWANAETYQTAGRMDLSAVEADEAEILEELLPKEPTKEELNAALLKLALDKGWYDDNEEHDIHPVQIPKNQMGIAVKELKAKYPAADGKKIADLVKANLCN
jgi:uncharacterized protein YqeY